MTTLAKETSSKIQMKKPYSLRRLRTAEIGNNVGKYTAKQSSVPLSDSLNQNNDSDDDDEEEENMDVIDNIVIYSFSNERKLKNFHAQNQLKLAQQKIKNKEENEMNKFLKKLDDNLISDKSSSSSSSSSFTPQKHDDIVWQPNIKRNTAKSLRSLSIASDASTSFSLEDDLPECGKAHCKLGCICDALSLLNDEYASDTNDSNRNNKLERDHCGRIDCMFACNCGRKLRSSLRSNNKEKVDTYKTTNKKQQQQSSLSKKLTEVESNRRMSKRLKSAYKLKRTNSNKNTNKPKSSNKSKSILNKSAANDYDDGERSSSEDSVANKELNKRNLSLNETDVNSKKMPFDENETNATRKSKRVKILNKKFNNDENVAHLSLNDFYYYSNKSVKQNKNKVLNNRLNENYLMKKDKTQKVHSQSQSHKQNFDGKKTRTSTKEEAINETDENSDRITQNSIDCHSFHEEFIPYTKNVSLRITSGVKNFGEGPRSASAMSKFEAQTTDYIKIPLCIKIFTRLWEEDDKLRMQVLRKIARMLQDKSSWEKFKFDYETLSVEVISSQPIQVNINERKTDTTENKNILSLNDLVSTSLKIRSRLKESENFSKNLIGTFENDSNMEKMHTISNNQNLHHKLSQLGGSNQQSHLVKSINENSNQISFIKPATKSLPRLISRSRSNKQLESNNKTGILLKKVDSLFERIKSERDFYTTISKSLLILRPLNINYKDQLFRDEILYFSDARFQKSSSSEYPFYNPFTDEKLVLGMYKKHESRDLVDIVCDMVNDMISACCKLEERMNEGNSSKEIFQFTPQSVKSENIFPVHNYTKPNIIYKNNSLGMSGKLPVTLTTVKKSDPSNKLPIPLNNILAKLSTNSIDSAKADNPPIQSQKSLVYQIINSTEISKKQNLINLIKNANSNNTFQLNTINPASHLNNQKVVYVNKPSSNPSKTPISTFKFESLNKIEDEMISDNESPPSKAFKEENSMSTVKTIMSSTTGALNYKTLVKIVTPEKNNPEGNPKIKISSSYLMRAHSTIPGINKNPSDSVTAPKLVTIHNNQMSDSKKSITPISNQNQLSSFVPIKPKRIDAPTTKSNTGYLKSIVCSIPVVKPGEISKGLNNDLQKDSHKFSYQSEAASNQRAKQNAIITLVSSNPNKKNANLENIENRINKINSIGSNDSMRVLDDTNKTTKYEIRKRKRKQDLSSLKNQLSHVSLGGSNFENSEHYNSDEFNSIILKKNNQFEDSSNYYNPLCDRSHFVSAFNRSERPIVNRSNFDNKKFAFRSISGPSILNKNRHKRNELSLSQYDQMNSDYKEMTQQTKNQTKNFSSSPDSNESIYSTSTPLPFEMNSYDKSALIQYKEDSDEEYNIDENRNCSFKFTNEMTHELDNDVIEIDSISSNEQDYSLNENVLKIMKKSQNYSILDSSKDKPKKNVCMNEGNQISNYKLSTMDDNDSDSSDSSLPNVTFIPKDLEKSTVNNIHSIRERQRRLKLKNLLMKLKIQLFEIESDSKYELDDTESQMKLDEYCNNRNFNKKSLKSKQNILQEAVNLIKNLQIQQRILEKIRLEKKLEYEKNLGIRNYLLSLQK